LVWFLHGFVVVNGQKVPLQRQRLRGKNSGEVRLGTYELFQQTRHLDDQVWWKMLRGLTTRNYPLVTRSFAEANGIEKSAISQRFIQASREKLKTLMERPLGDLKLCAVVIDGTLQRRNVLDQLPEEYLQRPLLLVLCISLNSCQSHKANPGPSIEFTRIPPAAQGGRARVDTISGRVSNARPKQQIVIYAHSGPWWVQLWPPYLGS
jgi:hypothetical protein